MLRCVDEHVRAVQSHVEVPRAQWDAAHVQRRGMGSQRGQSRPCRWYIGFEAEGAALHACGRQASGWATGRGTVGRATPKHSSGSR